MFCGAYFEENMVFNKSLPLPFIKVVPDLKWYHHQLSKGGLGVGSVAQCIDLIYKKKLPY